MNGDPWTDPHVMALAKAVDRLYEDEHNAHERRARLVALIAEYEQERINQVTTLKAQLFDARCSGFGTVWDRSKGQSRGGE
jgi:hypothetical protein